MGADDFIGKPYDEDELVERVNAVLRRASPSLYKENRPTRIEVGQLMIDPKYHTIRVSDNTVRLTKTEYQLLTLLASQQSTVNYETFGESIWGTSDGVSHTINVHMERLRKKLEAAGMTDPMLTTIRGYGYALTRA
jgi:DNA-binding response OmpR family regulator